MGILLMPASAKPDARRIVVGRALRGFVDGSVSVGLSTYLGALGFGAFEIGAIVTGTLLGSAALTLVVGIAGHGWRRRSVLLGASVLMAATGLGFAVCRAFVPLLFVAVIGTLNPSSGDVSVFLPTEQAVLAGAVEARETTALFARYNLAGTFAAAAGALASGLVAIAARALSCDLVVALRAQFVGYAAIAVLVGAVYTGLSREPARASESRAARSERTNPAARPLARSRRVVLKLSALFSLDSLGGGFVVQSLLALWLWKRFALSLTTMGTVFFASGLLASFSQLASARLAARVGLVRTMVFTHIPANVLLILAGVMPTAPWAIAALLLRMALSQMDVPARQSLVMTVVPPEERSAAASVTNVPRSLAAALTPMLAGAMLAKSNFGWPLVCGGVAKIAYDVILFALFRDLAPDPAATGRPIDSC